VRNVSLENGREGGMEGGRDGRRVKSDYAPDVATIELRPNTKYVPTSLSVASPSLLPHSLGVMVSPEIGQMPLVNAHHRGHQ